MPADAVEIVRSISMTWPQYLRRECTYNGAAIKLSRRQTDVLSVLLIKRNIATLARDLIPMVYDTDVEPDYAENIIGLMVMRLRAKLPGVIHSRYGFGYVIYATPPPNPEPTEGENGNPDQRLPDPQ